MAVACGVPWCVRTMMSRCDFVRGVVARLDDDFGIVDRRLQRNARCARAADSLDRSRRTPFEDRAQRRRVDDSREALDDRFGEQVFARDVAERFGGQRRRDLRPARARRP